MTGSGSSLVSRRAAQCIGACSAARSRASRADEPGGIGRVGVDDLGDVAHPLLSLARLSGGRRAGPPRGVATWGPLAQPSSASPSSSSTGLVLWSSPSRRPSESRSRPMRLPVPGGTAAVERLGAARFGQSASSRHRRSAGHREAHRPRSRLRRPPRRRRPQHKPVEDDDGEAEEAEQEGPTWQTPRGARPPSPLSRARLSNG